MRAGAEDEEDDAEEDLRNGWERLKGEVLRRTEWRGRGRKEKTRGGTERLKRER